MKLFNETCLSKECGGAGVATELRAESVKMESRMVQGEPKKRGKGEMRQSEREKREEWSEANGENQAEGK